MTRFKVYLELICDIDINIDEKYFIISVSNFVNIYTSATLIVCGMKLSYCSGSEYLLCGQKIK